MIVVAAPAPTIDMVRLAPRSPTAFPSQPPALVPLVDKIYVPAGRLMVVLSLAGRFANWRAPRRLQSLPAAVHAETAANEPPEGSSVLSTVIVVFGALGTTLTLGPVDSSTIRSVTPLSLLGSAKAATGALST